MASLSCVRTVRQRRRVAVRVVAAEQETRERPIEEIALNFKSMRDGTTRIRRRQGEGEFGSTAVAGLETVSPRRIEKCALYCRLGRGTARVDFVYIRRA